MIAADVNELPLYYMINDKAVIWGLALYTKLVRQIKNVYTNIIANGLNWNNIADLLQGMPNALIGT